MHTAWSKILINLYYTQYTVGHWDIFGHVKQNISDYSRWFAVTVKVKQFHFHFVTIPGFCNGTHMHTSIIDVPIT